ncbi:transcriptional regulator [Sphaerisporangium krabiense]|uniref:AcrR family transcriptional regulator n=1 Tax=Sphaerisporangium krabiense TaxID=763782 RepID=A0A7W9DQI7_9ACTN|nr:TetR/AcrR family transcriptional regulator [Sphaerisporangium krabiense]MBB5627458.1 AcrR family transcriptional regulator [Sphaerisporangium krabiense]GII64404.1 transcriptional regulator [Sphaerisporangium krabiense]
MPKRVDHDQRRRQITEALWRIAAERGIEAVSIREVATEAGMSIGLVQHFFASKDEMLMFATSHLREKLEGRIRRGLTALPEPATPLETLRALLVALLPLDHDSREETLVGIAFFIRALNDPVLATRYRQGRDQLTAAVADQLRAIRRDAKTDLEPTTETRPEPTTETDLELTAETLLALVEGLASDLLLGRHSPQQALRILDHHLQTSTRGLTR